MIAIKNPKNPGINKYFLVIKRAKLKINKKLKRGKNISDKIIFIIFLILFFSYRNRFTNYFCVPKALTVGWSNGSSPGSCPVDFGSSPNPANHVGGVVSMVK